MKQYLLQYLFSLNFRKYFLSLLTFDPNEGFRWKNPLKILDWKQYFYARRDDCDTEAKNIVLKTTFGYQKLYYHDIEYAEAQNKRVIFYLRSGKTVESIELFYSFVKRFTNCDGFFKCHRSYLPNVNYFNTTEIITKSGRRIPISRGYRKPFQEAYFSRMFGE